MANGRKNLCKAGEILCAIKEILRNFEKDAIESVRKKFNQLDKDEKR